MELKHYLWLAGITLGLTMVTMLPFLVMGTMLVGTVLVGCVLLTVRLDLLYRRKRVPDFHRKRVFITGTDTGFGRELVLKLDRKGIVVYAGCYTIEGGEKLRADASSNVRILYIDVAKRETLEHAKEDIERDLPPGEGLWGVVNNAGIVRGVLFDFCTEQDFRDTMEVNFFGAVRTVEVFAPLIKRAHGRIVNVISVAGRVSLGAEPYTCSKHALEPYCDGLRRSMRKFGVHVAIIEPGSHKTNISSASLLMSELDRTWNRMPQTLKEEYGEKFLHRIKKALVWITAHQPFASLNELHHVTNAIAHALSSERPKARYVCGLDGHLIIRMASLTPDWLTDSISVYEFALWCNKRTERLRT